MTKNILFVCKHNRFRSKYAEAIFKKLNKNSKYKSKSAGLIRGTYPLDKAQVLVGEKIGIRIKSRPKGLSSDILYWADIIIIVADNVPLTIFDRFKKYGKKIIRWRIKDVESGNKKDIFKTIKLIEKRVKKFLGSLM